MAEKIFFIVNKYSGKGFQSAIEGEIIDACSEAGVEGTIEYTHYRGHATDLAKQAVDAGFPRIFVRGGDGTVNEAARSIVHTSSALGILPAGSGNGLARHLRVPLNLHGALRQLSHFKTMTMDTLRINGGLSVNVSGFGFDAHVAHHFGKAGKRGLVEYARLVLGGFMYYKEFDVKSVCDGKPQSNRAFMVALANASQFGLSALVAPDASISDGILDVCFIRRVPLTEAAPFLAKMFTGKIGYSRFVTLVKAKRFTAELSEPQLLHLDGEPIQATRSIDASIDPASLNVVVPA